MASTTAATTPPLGLANSTDPSADFCHISFGAAVALVIANIAIAICGLALNILVILVITRNRVLRSDTTNRLLVSLAFADLIVNTLGQPGFAAQVVYTYKGKCLQTWAYHAFTLSCSTSVFLSMLCLTMVTIERFLAVKTPVFHRRFLKPQLVTKVIVFIVLATVSYQLYSYHERKKERSFSRGWVFGVFSLTAIIMNTCTMIFTRRFLQKRSQSSSRNTAERRALKAKTQRVTLLLFLLVVALMTWFLIIIIVVFYFADLITLIVVYGILTLVFLNSCINPIAYCLMAPDIRKATHLFIRAANPLNSLKRRGQQQGNDTSTRKT